MTAPDPSEDGFLSFLREATPGQMRAMADLVAADPQATPGCHLMVRLLRALADRTEADWRAAGIDFGSTPG